MSEQLQEALTQLRAAIQNEGPQPRYHRQIMRKHRKEWPTLWSAIDRVLLAEAHTDWKGVGDE